MIGAIALLLGIAGGLRKSARPVGLTYDELLALPRPALHNTRS